MLIEGIHAYYGKNDRKIQNADIIPTNETVIFLDLGEACNTLSLIAASISKLICVQN